MLKQSENNTIQALGAAERDAPGATDCRKPWKSPQVIIGTLDLVEAASNVAADNSGHS